MNLDNMAKELLFCLGAFQKVFSEKAQNISQGEIGMLVYFSEHHSQVTPTELSLILDLSTARVANTLNSLEKKGFIRRIHDSSDRRKVFVEMTDLGQEEADHRFNEAISNLKLLLTHLGDKDANEYLRLIKKVTLFMSQEI